MRFPLESKIEKVVSREKLRPVISNAYLRITETTTGRGKSKTTTRAGMVEATDSYRLARIPVELDESDVEGFVPPQAFAEARRANKNEIAANGAIVVAVKGGQLTLDRPDVAIGRFPNTDTFVPKGADLFTVGLNAELLLGLAQALGAKKTAVQLTFVADKDGKLNPTMPIKVRGLQGSLDGAEGLLMPVRVA